jgi:diguanylate cyclase (GGDEF)-like protein
VRVPFASLRPLAGRIGDKHRLIATLSLLLCLAFAATATVNYQVSSSAIRESIVASELPLTSDNLYSEIQKDLIRPVLISSMMASDTFLRDWVLAGERDNRAMVKYLREIKDRYGAFTSFFISERTRTYYQTEGVLKTVREDEPRDVWYFRVRAMSAPYEINVDPDLANQDTMTIFINYRVLDYGKRFLGVAGVGITMDAARALIDSYQKRYGRDIYFVDRRGAITLIGQNSRVQASDVRAIEGMGAIADGILRTGAGSFQYTRGGRERLLNVRLIPELDWFLFVEGTADEALEGVRRTLYANLIICILVTVIVLLATSLTINRYQSRLEEMATTDKLTGLANRQAFDLLVPQAISEALRHKAPLCAILIDIDHFKAVNDRLGHLAGDKALRSVAGIIKSSLRASDIVARWGGEEFLVILKNVVPTQAVLLAEKIRQAVEDAPIAWRSEAIRLTVSLGVAAHRDGDTPDQLIARADRALYEAKEQGRNRVQ